MDLRYLFVIDLRIKAYIISKNLKIVKIVKSRTMEARIITIKKVCRAIKILKSL